MEDLGIGRPLLGWRHVVKSPGTLNYAHMLAVMLRPEVL